MSAETYKRDLESRAERELAMVAKLTPRRTPLRNAGDIGDIGDAAPHNGFSVPEPRGQVGTAPEPKAHFEVVTADPARKPGVYWVGVVKDKETGTATGYAAPMWICSPMKVLAMTRDGQNAEWGRLLAFDDADGREHRWTCPQSMHSGSGDELRAVLLREGLTITTQPNMRRMVGDYIQQATTDTRARCVNRTGWQGDAFVLPRETFGDTDAEPVLFQAASIDGVTLGQAGTLAGWIERVAKPCAGNSRLVLAACMGFAGPCLGMVKTEGGGIHLRGPSSCGKSTALQVAASLYGPPDAYVRTWRATDNGLEGVAAMHSDLLMVLDEIGQLEPKHAGQVAYMLANGQGKSRSARDGSARAVATWRVLFLSAGEVGLSDLVTQSGGKLRAGQEVRVVDLPADANKGMGLFDSIPEGITAASFADTLKAEAAKHHGHALPAFLRALVADPSKARDALRALCDDIAANITPTDAAGQVRRVAGRFALIAAAGELATAYKLTGWNTDEAARAAGDCFNAWMGARDATGNAEDAAMLAQVRAFLEKHGESRFTRWDATDARTINRAGYRRNGMDGPTYFIDLQCFRDEVCQGFDYHAVATLLRRIGALQAGGDGRDTVKPRLPDGSTRRVYVVTPALWGDA